MWITTVGINCILTVNHFSWSRAGYGFGEARRKKATEAYFIWTAWKARGRPCQWASTKLVFFNISWMKYRQGNNIFFLLSRFSWNYAFSVWAGSRWDWRSGTSAYQWASQELHCYHQAFPRDCVAKRKRKISLKTNIAVVWWAYFIYSVWF